ncbi:ATP-binding cassette domain-containing protein [Jiulongibacter sediminis]|uniref:ABC transporter n=1 Tax=Jiulongibacter sediminis TaxID=1605367 RepID=A0A0P7BCU5_9BACT|nr:ATP-binding cassette domain-containing protein [Jiulongibacter sediminis]KPM48448.1 ABC transporter [Jiulongibacter sediminis]TBX24986.1 ABC transporter [Jiulongibacter sediminis]
MIQFHKVSIKKGDQLILSELDFQIEFPFKIAIAGENGSGKSTLLDAIAGKIFPFQGKIEKPHYSEILLVPRDYSFNRMVGAAYQYYQQRYSAYDSEIGPTLWEVLQNQAKPVGTVDEKSVELPSLQYEPDWVDEIAELMNVSHLLQRKITSLSNGETRRSLIAWALLQKPKLLLLDNPFTGLDTASKELLKEIINKLDVSILLVAGANDLPDSIESILILKDGRLAQTLTPPFGDLQQEERSLNIDHDQLPSLFPETEEDFEVAFSIKNGLVKYGEKKALDGVNWVVKNGECWALMGPNGSGKTTLLSLLTADNPKAYQNDIVLFDKKRGTGESIWDIKKKIGFVSPELHLFFPKNSTVLKVVASGLFDSIGLYRKLKPEEETKAAGLLKFFDLSHLSDRLLSHLSTGEQRLVLLARALIKNPPILLLDEPCQNLDYQHMVYFRNLINELVTSLNKTLIYVTHNPEEIPTAINKTIYLENGKVIKCD